eukprot:COSAG01_NODE_4396_length_5067_cov_23.845813_2_plen_37_part_00
MITRQQLPDPQLLSLILISRPISRKSCTFFIWIGSY